MQHPETVTVSRNGVPTIINKDDHDPKNDKLWEETITAKGKGKAPTAAEPVEPPPMLAGNPVGQPEGQVVTPTVIQKGDTYFVVDDKGEHDARFDPKGYKTDVAAWTEVAKFETKTVTA